MQCPRVRARARRLGRRACLPRRALTSPCSPGTHRPGIFLNVPPDPARPAAPPRCCWVLFGFETRRLACRLARRTRRPSASLSQQPGAPPRPADAARFLRLAAHAGRHMAGTTEKRRIARLQRGACARPPGLQSRTLPFVNTSTLPSVVVGWEEGGGRLGSVPCMRVHPHPQASLEDEGRVVELLIGFNAIHSTGQVAFRDVWCFNLRAARGRPQTSLRRHDAAKTVGGAAWHGARRPDRKEGTRAIPVQRVVRKQWQAAGRGVRAAKGGRRLAARAPRRGRVQLCGKGWADLERL
jgi:hypothetical protein